MRITYVLLSPTLGMHQYTADLAGRMAKAGHAVSLVTTRQAPLDRYGPEVAVSTPVATEGTGLSAGSLMRSDYAAAREAVPATRPDVVHFTGPHVWNPLLMGGIQKAGVPAVHTVHDLDPHHGRRMGFLLRPWNRAVTARADLILVHGEVYRERLVREGAAPKRVAATPLLHLFVSQEAEKALARSGAATAYEPMILFFGRLEAYKGVETLLAAFVKAAERISEAWRLVLAGQGDLGRAWRRTLPARVEVRNRFIGDEEAVDLFRRCSLVVLPYVDATQSALPAAAYFFRKPVLVTRSGALAEYVTSGETGFVVRPGDVDGLAEGLIEATADRDRLATMGEAGRRWYEAQRAQDTARLEGLYASMVVRL